MRYVVFLLSKAFGQSVGTDERGNTYYKGRFKCISREMGRERRWVYYASGLRANDISKDWFNWLHYRVALPPERYAIIKSKEDNYYRNLFDNSVVNSLHTSNVTFFVAPPPRTPTVTTPPLSQSSHLSAQRNTGRDMRSGINSKTDPKKVGVGAKYYPWLG